MYTSKRTLQVVQIITIIQVGSQKCDCLVEKVTGWSFYNLKDF